jgi:hypothetical protein
MGILVTIITQICIVNPVNIQPTVIVIIGRNSAVVLVSLPPQKFVVPPKLLLPSVES